MTPVGPAAGVFVFRLFRVSYEVLFTMKNTKEEIIHRRDAEDAEFGVFINQEFFSPRPQRLGGGS
jgi:hypothetical protein